MQAALIDCCLWAQSLSCSDHRNACMHRRDQNTAGRRRLQRLVAQPGYGAALRPAGGMRERGRVPNEDEEFAAELQAALQQQEQQQQRQGGGGGAPGWRPARGRGRAAFLAEARGAPQLERSGSGKVDLAPHAAGWAAAGNGAADGSAPDSGDRGGRRLGSRSFHVERGG